MRFLNLVHKNSGKIRNTNREFRKQLNFEGVKFTVNKKDYIELKKANNTACSFGYKLIRANEVTEAEFNNRLVMTKQDHEYCKSSSEC